MNELEKLKAMGASDEQAHLVAAELQKQNLGFSDLVTLLPVLVKLIPALKEFWQKVQESGVIDIVTGK